MSTIFGNCIVFLSDKTIAKHKTAYGNLSFFVSLPPFLLSWSAKLYLTPSNSVLLTAIALIGVCVFILVIIGILHWQEKVRTHTHRHRVACCS